MHNDPEYVEHQEGPDGQYCDLLKRVPYDRQRMIEISLRDASTTADAMDGALRGMLWECSVKDSLTGEVVSDIEKAAAEVVQPWRIRSMELYNDWHKQAFPGPKGSPRKDSRTPTSGKKTAAPEMSAPR